MDLSFILMLQIIQASPIIVALLLLFYENVISLWSKQFQGEWFSGVILILSSVRLIETLFAVCKLDAAMLQKQV